MKEIKIKNGLEDVKTEIAIMKKMYHPNLIQLHEVIDDENSEQIIMGHFNCFLSYKFTKKRIFFIFFGSSSKKKLIKHIN